MSHDSFHHSSDTFSHHDYSSNSHHQDHSSNNHHQDHSSNNHHHDHSSNNHHHDHSSNHHHHHHGSSPDHGNHQQHINHTFQPDYHQAPIIVMPPPTTGGIFLDVDQPVLVQPSAHSSRGPNAAIEYLKNVTALNIRQKIELVEILTSIDTQNRFTIYDNKGQTVFYALEDSDFCTRQCCGPARPFEMKILDVFQNEVIHLTRPLGCQGCCCFCCLMSLDVSSPPGNIIGKVQQKWSIFEPNYAVENAVGDTVALIKGPFCPCSCGSDVIFKVLTPDGNSEIGEISKKWSGFAQEYLTDADNFGITFKSSLDYSTKATLLGAVFLIDVMYFERKKRN